MPHNALANFVETQNIARFRALLATETHPDKRKILIRLLEQEEAGPTRASVPLSLMKQPSVAPNNTVIEIVAGRPATNRAA